MSAVFDKTGREIMQGDILKVFHFVGHRNKHHFMYKQVVGERLLGKAQNAYWRISHLNQRDDDGYYLAKDGSVRTNCEIVQSIDASFEDRPRLGVGDFAGSDTSEASTGPGIPTNSKKVHL